MRVRSRVLVAATTSLVLGAPTAALNQSASAADHPRPDPATFRAAPTAPRLLAGPAHGRSAVRALGSHLPDAASLNGTTAARLKSLLAEDPSAWVGADGRLFYVEDAPVPAAATTISGTTSASSTVPYPLADTFTLHSLPTSTHTIYLDFDGVTLDTNNYWTTSGGMTPGTFTGFSLDSDPAFSDAEKIFIQQVWQIVAEKYAPFDVDVTTEDPGPSAYNRSGAGDNTYGDHVVITDDPSAVSQACGGGCSGIALVNTFDDTYYTGSELEPAWVFSSKTYGSAALTAHTAAHEIGHTFGLHHDGISGGASYYGGQGNWFPLMGSGVRAIGQFSKGEYTGANNTEDDLAMIAANGAPVRPDDYGSTPATATSLGSQYSYTVDGVIETASDKDVFSVDRPCTDDLVVSATGIGEGTALDLKLTVLDGNQNVLGTDDPASGQDTSAWPYLPTGTDAGLTFTAPSAGTYYVQVEGVGHGDPATNGYSDYDSLGQYRLTITGCNGVAGAVPSSPTTVTATPAQHSTTATISWGAPTTPGDAPVSGYRITGLPSGNRDVDAATFSVLDNAFVPGTSYPISVQALNTYGASTAAQVTARIDTWAPTDPAPLSVSAGTDLVSLSWSSPANPGNATLTGWHLVLTGPTGTLYDGVLSAISRSGSFVGLPADSYRIDLTPQVTADDTSGVTTTSRDFTVPTTPSRPRIRRPWRGAIGWPITAVARWRPPLSNGGSRITGYRVKAQKRDSSGHIVKVIRSRVLSPNHRRFSMRLARGRYTFVVVAYNAQGHSPNSRHSRMVRPR